MFAQRKNGRPPSLYDRRVRFRIADACVPNRDEILRELHGQDTLQGKVIDLSDSGHEHEIFAVVEVRGLSKPVVVPVAKLLEIKN